MKNRIKKTGKVQSEIEGGGLPPPPVKARLLINDFGSYLAIKFCEIQIADGVRPGYYKQVKSYIK